MVEKLMYNKEIESVRIKEPKINVDKDDIEKYRRKERERIKSKFSELIGKQILIKDMWTKQEFEITVDHVEEIDLPFPGQCIVHVRWLDEKEEQCLGSSFYYKRKEFLDLKTEEIVFTSDVNTERKLNNYDENNVMDKSLHDMIVRGDRMPARYRRFEIIDTLTK